MDLVTAEQAELPSEVLSCVGRGGVGGIEELGRGVVRRNEGVPMTADGVRDSAKAVGVVGVVGKLSLAEGITCSRRHQGEEAGGLCGVVVCDSEAGIRLS